MEVAVAAYLAVVLLAVAVLYALVWKPARLRRVLLQQGVAVSVYWPGPGDLLKVRRAQAQAQAEPLPLSAPHQHLLPYILPFYHRLASQHPGSRVAFWFGPSPTLVVTNADDARCVLATDVKHLQRPNGSRRLFHRLMGHGLILAEGEDWHLQRDILRPAFYVEKLKNMVDDMKSSVLEMIQSWSAQVNEGNVEIEVFQDLKNVAADILTRTMFGTSYIKGRSVFERQEQLFELIIKNWVPLSTIPFFTYIPTRANRKMKAMDKRNNKELNGIIDLRRTKLSNAEKETNSKFPYGTDLLGHVLSSLEAERQVGGRSLHLKSQQVIDECKTFFFAGHETVASFLVWTMVALSLHQSWQGKAREEVIEVCGRRQAPTAANLDKLKIVEMILNETLRLYPVLPEFGRRKLQKDVTLDDGTVLPKGMAVVIACLFIQADKKVWGADAAEFRPERFANGVSQSCKNPSAFMPFGAGPRNCIGQKLALLEVKVTIALILQHFRFRLAPSYCHAPVGPFSLWPRHGVPLLLELI